MVILPLSSSFHMWTMFTMKPKPADRLVFRTVGGDNTYGTPGIQVFVKMPRAAMNSDRAETACRGSSREETGA